MTIPHEGTGAEETYPFIEEVAVITVGGKMFALVPLYGEPGSVNLKCELAQALELREEYPDPPGYHQNNRQWNTGGPRRLGRGRRRARTDLGLLRPIVAGLPRSIRAGLAPD